MTDRTHYCAGCKERQDHIEKLEADNARLREAMKGPLAWLERWVVHVGNCKGDSACTCGLTFVQHELCAALAGEQP